MQPIDVTIVATRRPDLLSRTLASFQQNLFRHLGIGRLFLNIDPLWGDDVADRAVETVARDYFSDVTIRRPSSPSFGAAVKWLWAQPRTEWCLHLEDDWLLNHPVANAMLDAGMSGIVLHNRRNTLFRKRKFAPKYNTGPQFIRSRHAHQIAALIDCDLDPEKQGYNGTNPPLADYLKAHRYRYWGGRFTPYLLQDIGRDWLKARGVTKRIINGASVWSS